MMPRFHAIHFGCRANQADGAAIAEDLAGRGFPGVEDCRQADVVVLTSCTVTAAADAELRQTVRRIHRQNPRARILVTGCYAQRRPDELAALPGVRWVVGNTEKHKIGRLVSEHAASSCALQHAPSQWVPVEQLLAAPVPESAIAFHTLSSLLPGSELSGGAQIVVGDIFAQREFLSAPVLGRERGKNAGDRTRPTLKIQDGCNNRCSFCIIPSVRGRSRSLPPREVVRQVGELCAAGYREVVLSGINLGRYGRDLHERIRFARLAEMILDETPVERLRLSSVEPMDFTDELLDLMADSSRIANHVHAPLQSGSDRILRRMHRKYQARHYRERMLAAYARMPNAAFGADVMVGFPGETEDDFEQTRRLIESLPFTYLHVFPFSRRPGTPANTMPDQVPGAVVRERGRLLRELAAEKNRRFREKQVGRTLSVLTLEDRDEGGTGALSDNYLRVILAGEPMPANRLVDARIVALHDEGLVGEPIFDRLPHSRGAAIESPSMMTCASA
jgi:threonylcarbamoyladenosine tRNA methylthiotransferase MtaB